MHADLVRAARARLNAAERVAAKPLDNLVETARLLARLVSLIVELHLHAVVGMVADTFLDVVAVAVEHARGEGEIFLEDLAALELGAEVAVCGLFLRDQNDAARVAVETVDDARTIFSRSIA